MIRIWKKNDDDWKSVAFSDSWCSWGDLIQFIKAAMIEYKRLNNGIEDKE